MVGGYFKNFVWFPLQIEMEGRMLGLVCPIEAYGIVCQGSKIIESFLNLCLLKPKQTQFLKPQSNEMIKTLIKVIF
jgi:hypothetical protein